MKRMIAILIAIAFVTTVAGTVFGRTLDEEKAADKKLTQIAEGLVNPRAAEAGTEFQRRKAA